MAGVDSRIVNMTFQSAQFLSGASQVLSALEKLKSSLNNLKGGGKALSDINAAGKNVDLSGIGKGVDSLVSKFGFLSVAASAAFATVVTKAVMAGGQLLKSFTVDPIIAGLHEYENELNTTAVIMANTGLSGEKGMAQIRTALGELNTYADKTIYSFEDMTSAIGKFTAAGVSLNDSVVAIKGLANLAALSGSTAQQAAVAQYQLSQAIATGTIRLMDWNSVVNAGMGGKVFQQSLIQTARVHGVAVDDMIKKNGSFRESLQEGWLTSKILLETLSKFTGDLGKEQLKQMGYTDKQIAQIQKQAQAAVDAATKVRTVTQLISTVGEAVQSAWAGVWRAVFGNMEEATKLWTSVGAALTKVFVGPIENLKKLAEGWAELGGRAVMINAVSDAFKILGSILKPIGAAFRDVFPAMTAQRLVDMTKSLHDFINGLKPSAATLQNLHSIFEGLFSGLKIGMDIFKGIIGVIGQMLHAATGLGGGVLGLGAHIGRFVTHLKDSIESGTAFANFFRNVGTILSAPIKVLSAIGSVIADIAEGAGKALSALQPFFAKVVQGFASLGDALANSIRSGDFSKFMTVLNEGLFAGILLAVRNFIKNFGDRFAGGGGIIDSIKSIFGGLASTLRSFQANLNAGTLQKIAIAVGILTVAIVALSMIDAGKLAKALSGISVAFAELGVAMNLIAKISPVGIVSMMAVAVAMNLLATAVVILAAAVTILSRLSWAELAKGLSAVAVMMGLFTVAVKLMSGNTAGVLAASVAMIAMAIALNIMAAAVALLGNMDWGTLIKGVGTIAALLLVVAGFNKIGGGKNLIATAASMLVLGAALNVIALAVKQLGSMSLGDLAKGLVAVAAALVIIAVGMSLMPPSMLLTAASILVLSAALVVLAGALNMMGGMSWGEIGKSLVVLAGSLVILAAAMYLMTGALPGAAALLVIAAALMILTPVLVTLGSLSWGTLLTALGALAAVFLLLGVAGLLLGPLVPVLMGLGVALILMGAACLAVGAGIALLGVGLTAIGIAVQTTGAAILSFITGIINLIPLTLQKIGQGIIAFAGAIAKGGAALIAAFTTLLTALLTAVIKVMPLIGKAISQILTLILNLIIQYAPRAAQAMAVLIMAVLTTIANNIGKFVQKGTDIIVGFLRGIANNLGRVIRAATDVVVSFINGIAANVGRVADAGAKMVVACVNAIANAIRGNSGAMRAAGANLGSAIIGGITSGLWGAAGGAISAASSIAGSILGALGKAIQFFSPSHKTYLMGIALAEGLAYGMRDSIPMISKSADNTGRSVLRAISTSLAGIETGIGEIRPVITPIINLSEARRGFDDLAAMAATQISAGVSASAAASISPNIPGGSEGGTVSIGGTTITFTQNNNSPKALSAAEIYRQTRNQLSTMRGALP
jgi:tape measure domain-containing protein